VSIPPFRSATSLVADIRAGRLSAVEAARAAIDLIETLNPKVHAVVTTCVDEALAAAQRADQLAREGRFLGRLHGVPILVKDLFDFRAGLRNTFGCRAMADFIPDFTVEHVARLEAAGATLLGKTNTPEFGHKGVTDNLLFGPTCCPFDLRRNAGGSSGGSAAAVAVGMVPLAQGSDAGGSIRIPAAWSGVVGFKPTFGRIPLTRGSNAFGLTSPFVHVGPLTRTIADAALMAQVMAGPHADDPFCIPDDGMNLLEALKADAADLRVAYSRDLGVFAVEPEVAQVVEQSVAALADDGQPVEQLNLVLPISQDELAQLWLRQIGVLYLELFDTIAQQGPDLLTQFRDDIPEPIHAMVEQARRFSALDVRHDEALRTMLWRSIQQAFDPYDIVLTPTVGALPVLNSSDGRTMGPEMVCGRPVERCIGWCLTHPFNFTGHPAASVPAGLSSGGLPVGMQVIGRRFADEQVITMCRKIEQVRPWMDDLEAAVARLAGPLDPSRRT
jgi:amidase/aspartyl-tRNA(Asn)/glutamyl-tRNA(Gln) amidotransferase subunit A